MEWEKRTEVLFFIYLFIYYADAAVDVGEHEYLGDVWVVEIYICVHVAMH